MPVPVTWSLGTVGHHGGTARRLASGAVRLEGEGGGAWHGIRGKQDLGGEMSIVGWGVWKQTYRREPRRGVALRVLEPVLVTENCGARGCSGQGWGATGLVGARRERAVGGGTCDVACVARRVAYGLVTWQPHQCHALHWRRGHDWATSQ